MNTFSFLLISCLITQGIQTQERNLSPFFQYFINNEYDSARVFIQRKQKEAPDDTILHYYLGKTYLALKQPAKAVDELQDGLEDKPTDARIHDYIGRAYEEQGIWEDIENVQLTLY